MSSRKKIIQLNHPANSMQDLYTCPSGKTFQPLLLTVTNRANAVRRFRVMIAQLGVAYSDEQYLRYDYPVDSNMEHTIDLSKYILLPTDKIRTSITTSGLTFTLTGIETEQNG